MRILPLVLVLGTAPVALAQNKPAIDTANPISGVMKASYERVKKFLIGAADLMPPADYAFKPTPDVRSFGQLIGHVADTQYMFCSAAKKETAPKKDSIEKTVTTKDGLKKALADAFAYCDAIYTASTDATLTQPVDLFGGKLNKFAALDINVAHDNEHYGNIVTYLRIKKLTPPSSAEK